jgi:hypothetical protein
MKIYLSVLIVLLISNSCNSGYEQGLSIHVYKLKADYTNLAIVQLSEDNSSLVGFPGRIDTSVYPIKLCDSYYLNGTVGINTAYISMSINDYNSKVGTIISPDSLFSLVIDSDPFLEFYHSMDGEGIWRSDDKYDEFRIDTALINTLIVEGRLEEYFDKLK